MTPGFNHSLRHPTIGLNGGPAGIPGAIPSHGATARTHPGRRWFRNAQALTMATMPALIASGSSGQLDHGGQVGVILGRALLRKRG